MDFILSLGFNLKINNLIAIILISFLFNFSCTEYDYSTTQNSSTEQMSLSNIYKCIDSYSTEPTNNYYFHTYEDKLHIYDLIKDLSLNESKDNEIPYCSEGDLSLRYCIMENTGTSTYLDRCIGLPIQKDNLFSHCVYINYNHYCGDCYLDTYNEFKIVCNYW